MKKLLNLQCLLFVTATDVNQPQKQVQSYPVIICMHCSTNLKYMHLINRYYSTS